MKTEFAEPNLEYWAKIAEERKDIRSVMSLRWSVECLEATRKLNDEISKILEFCPGEKMEPFHLVHMTSFLCVEDNYYLCLFSRNKKGHF